ncbi:MAG: hypothetical protein DIU72_005425 [Pseudomonadota bacterium]|nr:MAG: hypothetical protein DIU72_03045 [Pseudomonadota bacterium]
MRSVRFLVVALACLAPLGARAEYPKLELSGNVWGQWAYDLSFAHPDSPKPGGTHRFEVTRTYLNFRARLSPSISLRVTPDLVAATGTDGNLDGSLVLRLKFAYVDFEAFPALAVRALMQPTPYIGFSDGVWGYRVLGPDILEHFTGIRSSDVGLGLLGAPLGNYADYQVLLSNGEGYNRQERIEPEAGKYKDLAARLTLAPLAGAGPWLEGLRLTLFGQYGIRERILGARLERIRAMALATWSGPGFTLGTGGGFSADDQATEGRLLRRESFLWTSWGWVDLPLSLRAIGRLDLDVPDAASADDPGRRSRIIAGLAYRFTDDVQVIVNWERNDAQKPENGPLDAPRDSLFLRVAAEF